MAVVEMSKVSLLCHVSERSALIEELHSKGLLEIGHFKENHPEPECAEFVPEALASPKELSERLSALGTAVQFLDHYRPQVGALSRLGGERVEVTAREHRWVTEGYDFAGTVQECVRLHRRKHDVGSRLETLRSQRGVLLPWVPISIPFEEMVPTGRTGLRFAVLPSERFPQFSQEVPSDVHCEVVHEDGRNTYCALLFLKEVEADIGDLLKRFEVSEISFSGFAGTPQQALNGIEGEIAAAEEENRQIDRRGNQLAEHRSRLLILADHGRNMLARETIRERFALTRTAVMIEGWMKKADVATLRDRLEAEFCTATITEVEPLPEEVPPVELANRQWAKPFEMVTDLYGRPQYTEVDPTPVLTPFFAVFFALCVTDAGYGLMLSLISLLALKKLRVGPGMKKLFQLLLVSGLVTIGAGVVTGGYFGLDLNEMDQDALFVKVAYSLKVFDPLENAMTFFALALLCGVVHVFVGVAVKLYAGMRGGEVARSLLMNVPWLMATVGLGVSMIGFIVPLPDPVQTVATYLLAAGAIGIFLFQGMGSKTVLGHIGKGLGGLYGIIGIFGDILSYSRLLALGLATAVVAGVIDILGGMMMHIPYVGIFITIVLVVVAHLLYLVICCLGAFVHTARLHFVEFFSKFYEGGGKPFEPFQQRNDHTIIVAD